MAKQEWNGALNANLHTAAPIRRFSAGILESDNTVPVVLEFTQPPVAVYKCHNPQADAEQYRQELEKAHKEFLDNLTSLGMQVQVGSTSVVEAGQGGPRNLSVPHDFTCIFNGLGVLMPGRVVAQVAQMTGVRAVTLNREQVYLQLDQSVGFSGAQQMWVRADSAGRAIRGDGVVVAVIDTGVDWSHPEFGGFTEAPNEKVIYAASLTGENPVDNFGHGSHVACIIAGDADYKNTPRGDAKFNGMAPKAQLMGYKVLTAAGSGSATNIILMIDFSCRRFRGAA